MLVQGQTKEEYGRVERMLSAAIAAVKTVVLFQVHLSVHHTGQVSSSA